MSGNGVEGRPSGVCGTSVKVVASSWSKVGRVGEHVGGGIGYPGGCINGVKWCRERLTPVRSDDNDGMARKLVVPIAASMVWQRAVAEGRKSNIVCSGGRLGN